MGTHKLRSQAASNKVALTMIGTGGLEASVGTTHLRESLMVAELRQPWPLHDAGTSGLK